MQRACWAAGLTLGWAFQAHAALPSMLDACPDGSWTRSIYLRTSIDTSFFANISTWSQSDYVYWLTDVMLKDWIPSAVFFGLAVFTLLVLVLWRIFYAALKHFYECGNSTLTPVYRHDPYVVPELQMTRNGPGSDDGSQGSSHKRLEPPTKCCMARCCARPGCFCMSGTCCAPDTWDRALRGIKVAVVLLFLATMGICIWGLTGMSRGLSDQGWAALGILNAYVSQLAGYLEGLLLGMSACVPLIQQSQDTFTRTAQLPMLPTRIQSLSTWLDGSSWDSTSLSTHADAINSDVQALNETYTVLTTYLPDLKQSLPALTTSCNRLGSSFLPFVTASNRQFGNLYQALRGLPDAESASAVSTLQLALQELNVSNSITILNQLSTDVTTLYRWTSAPLKVLDQLSSPPPSPATSSPEAVSVPLSPLVAVSSSLAAAAQVVDDLQVHLPAFNQSINSMWLALYTGSESLYWWLHYLEKVNRDLYVLPDSLNQFLSKIGTLTDVQDMMMDIQGEQTYMSLNQLLVQSSLPNQLTVLHDVLNPVVSDMVLLPTAKAIRTVKNQLVNSTRSLTDLDPILIPVIASVKAYQASPSPETYSNILLAAGLATPVTGNAVKAMFPLALAAQSPTSAASTLANATQQMAFDLASLGTPQSNVDVSGLTDQVLGTMDGVWSAYTDLRPMGLLGRVTLASQQLKSVKQAMPVPRTQVLAGMQEELTSIYSGLVEGINSTNNEVLDFVNRFNDSVSAIHGEVVDQYTRLKGAFSATTSNVDDKRYKATTTVFIIALAVPLPMFLALVYGCPALLTVSALATALVSIVLFAVAVIIAFALAVGDDLCMASETVIISFIGARWRPMADYVFYEQGTLVGALAASDIIDVARLNKTLSSVQSRMIDPVTTRITPMGLFGAALTRVMGGVNTTTVTRDMLVGAARKSAFGGVYMNVKGTLCCEIPDNVYLAWYVCTMAGWCLLVAVWFCIMLIYGYDQMRGSSIRCGWVFLPVKDMPLKATGAKLSLEEGRAGREGKPVGKGGAVSGSRRGFWCCGKQPVQPVVVTGAAGAGVIAMDAQIVAASGGASGGGWEDDDDSRHERMRGGSGSMSGVDMGWHVRPGRHSVTSGLPADVSMSDNPLANASPESSSPDSSPDRGYRPISVLGERRRARLYSIR